MWLAAPLAKKVKRFGGETTKLHGGTTRFAIDASPFDMNDAIYGTWKARWAELAPVHVTNTGENSVAPYFRERFAAKTFGSLHTDWFAAWNAEHAKAFQENQISNRLRELAESPTKQLLEFAESIAKQMTSNHAWWFLPGLRTLIADGKAKPEEATVWLDITEQLQTTHLLDKAAAVAAVAGDHDRAIDMLRRAIKAGHVDPKHLARDPTSSRFESTRSGRS